LHCLSSRSPLVVSSHCPLVLLSCQLVVAPAGCRIIISRCPLVAPPSRSLIVLAGCCVASPCTTLWLSHCLSSSSHCAALLLSCRASWLLHCLLPSSHCATLSSSCHASLLSHSHSLSSRSAAHSSSCRAGWLLHLLSTHHPLVVSLSCRAASCCLVAPAGCRIISRRPLVAPHSCPLIVLAGCCVAYPMLPLPLNDIFIIYHH
jgi:hypothetical protein